MRGIEKLKMVKFALVGAVNTGVDFAVFVFLVYLVGLPSWFAQTLSYSSGVANSYWMNRKWTFRAGGRGNWREATRFVVVNGASFLTATAVLLLLQQGLSWSPLAAKLASVFFSVAVNYLGSRFWVFRRERRAN